MIRHLKAGAFGAALLTGSLMAGTAVAGEQFVDNTGFAASGYDVVAYHSLPQMPVGEAQPAPVPGKASITADYNGATWAFANEANRDAFVADPEKYAPAYDGHCAYGIAQGGKVSGNPELWRIVDGKLYLNVTRTVVGFWEADIQGNLKQSEVNWVGLEKKNSPGGPVPQFDASHAPVN